jgi:hypothetical protein
VSTLLLAAVVGRNATIGTVIHINPSIPATLALSVYVVPPRALTWLEHMVGGAGVAAIAFTATKSFFH